MIDFLIKRIESEPKNLSNTFFFIEILNIDNKENSTLTIIVNDYIKWIYNIKLNALIYNQAKNLYKILFIQSNNKDNNKIYFKYLQSIEVLNKKNQQYKNYKSNQYVDNVIICHDKYQQFKKEYIKKKINKDFLKIYKNIHHMLYKILFSNQYILLETIYNDTLDILNIDLLFFKNTFTILNNSERKYYLQLISVYFNFIKFIINVINDKLSDLYNQYIEQKSIIMAQIKQIDHIKQLKKSTYFFNIIKGEFLYTISLKDINHDRDLNQYNKEIQFMLDDKNTSIIVYNYILCLYIFLLNQKQIFYYKKMVKNLFNIYIKQSSFINIIKIT